MPPTTSALPRAPRPEKSTAQPVQHQLLWLAVVCILLLGCFAVMALAYLRNQALQTGERLTQTLAQVVEEQTTRTLQTVDQRLQMTILSMARLPATSLVSSPTASDLLREDIKALPFIQALRVTDAQGHIVYDSQPDTLGRDLSDRAYVQIHITQPQTAFYIGTPVRSRTTGEWQISASRAFRAADGKLQGIVIAALKPTYFDTLWRLTDLGEDSSIALLNRSGVLVMRSPFDGEAMGKALPNHPTFTQRLPQSPHGHYKSNSAIDGKLRHFAYRTLSQQRDLVVIVGQSYNALLSPWRQFALLTLGIWALASLAVLTLCNQLNKAWVLRLRSEERTDEMAQRLTMATDAASIGVWDWDLTTDQWSASPTYFTMLGYAPEDGFASREQWIGRMHPQDQIKAREKIASVLTTPETPFNYEVRIRHADGSYRWINTIGRLLQQEGAPRTPAHKRMLGVRIDITERKAIEDKLRSSDSALKAISQGVLIAGPDGHILSVNGAFLSISGFSASDILGNTCRFVQGPLTSAATIAAIHEATQAGVEFSGEILNYKKDGTLFWNDLTISPVRNEQQQLTHFIGVTRDITARKKAERDLQDSEGSYRELFQSNPLSMWVHDTKTLAFLAVNDAAIANYGYSREEFLSMSILDIRSPADAIQLTQHLATTPSGLVDAGLWNHRRKDGSPLVAQITAHTLAYGDRPAKLILANDVTDRKKAEAALRESTRQMQALSQRILEAQETERRRIARELHDELGQSLTAIKINLQSHQRFKNQSPEELNSENIRIVEDALQQVRRLALALRPSMLDDLGLLPALRWVAAQTATRSGFTAAVESALPPQTRLMPEIETACFRVAQEALTNIARHAKAKNVTLTLHQESDSLVLSVHDDGCGFDLASVHAYALAGASIGVLGMQERATLAGGQLEVTSAPDQGCTIRLRVPLRRHTDSL